MPNIPAFHSVNNPKKKLQDRVYHNNSKCAPGRDIPKREQVPGPSGHLCIHCKNYNAADE
jgi:hypothetical protein